MLPRQWDRMGVLVRMGWLRAMHPSRGWTPWSVMAVWRPSLCLALGCHSVGWGWVPFSPLLSPQIQTALGFRDCIMPGYMFVALIGAVLCHCHLTLIFVLLFCTQRIRDCTQPVHWWTHLCFTWCKWMGDFHHWSSHPCRYWEHTLPERESLARNGVARQSTSWRSLQAGFLWWMTWGPET